MSSSLVIQTSFLGDMVLTTPLIAAAREARPGRRGHDAGVGARCWRTIPPCASVIVYDKRGRGPRRSAALSRLARRLRAHGYDAALPRAGIGAQRRARAGWRASPIASASRRPPAARSTRKRVPYRDDLHHAARLLMLARRTAASRRRRSCARALPGRGGARTQSTRCSQHGGMRDGERLIAVAPGSVWATKRWPYYPELARELARRRAHRRHRRSAGDARSGTAIIGRHRPARSTPPGACRSSRRPS